MLLPGGYRGRSRARPSMNRFTHIGRALGEAVLTLALLPAMHAALLRITRGSHTEPTPRCV